MNRTRILVGGLVAGVVMNAIDVIANAVVLADRYAHFQETGFFLKEPRFPFLPLWILMLFGFGLGIAWLYAAVRPRLGPGPRTALLVGVVVGLMAHVMPNFAEASWAHTGRFMPLVWMIAGILECTLGALVAGALYRE
jgi:hypothetical protein